MNKSASAGRLSDSYHLMPRSFHSNTERYERFVTTFLHGEDWNLGFRYFAIYWLKFSDKESELFSPLFENGNSRCAEAHLMDHLQLQLSAIPRERLEAILVFQNSSPCTRCSARYEQELTSLIRNFRVKVTVVVSSLHRINRPSCVSENHNHSITDEEHTKNLNGLLRMRDCGIKLFAPEFKHWKKLRSALQLEDGLLRESSYNKFNRRKEDDRLREDLCTLLSVEDPVKRTQRSRTFYSKTFCP